MSRGQLADLLHERELQPLHALDKAGEHQSLLLQLGGQAALLGLRRSNDRQAGWGKASPLLQRILCM